MSTSPQPLPLFQAPPRQILKFHPPGEQPGYESLTLPDVYEQLIAPDQQDHAEATRSDYRSTMQHWKAKTGNPPLHAISDDTLRQFRDAFAGFSAKTVGKHLRNVNRVLKRVGPYDPYRNREGLDVLARLPWCTPPRWKKSARKRVNRVCPLAHMDELYRACSRADWPLNSAVPPPLLWRTVFVCLWTYGPRIDDLFRFESGTSVVLSAECPDPEIQATNPHGWLHFTTKKTDVELFLPISAVVRQHIDAIGKMRTQLFENPLRLFPCPMRPTSWMQARRQIQGDLFDGRPYTFQELRKTANVNWKQFDRDLGPAVVGHKLQGVNAEWYTNQVPKILRHLPDYPYPPSMLAFDGK